MSFTIASLLGFDNTKPIQTKSIATQNEQVYVVDRFHHQPSSKCFSWSQLDDQDASKHSNNTNNNNNSKDGRLVMKRCFDEDEDIDVVKCFNRTKGNYFFFVFSYTLS